MDITRALATLALLMAAAVGLRSARATRVSLLTDVEGNWPFVRRVARQSECLRLRGDDLELRDDCVLVFGGDAGDKGGETLKCYEQLVRLKRKYPDRVVLLVGNRDANKMRLTSELHDEQLPLSSTVPEIRDGPVWVPKDKRVTIRDFLAQQRDGDAAGSTCKVGSGEGKADEELELVNTKVNRLKWMLEHTMGSQGDFERRRRELKERQTSGGVAQEVSDDDVVASYMSTVEDGGVIREYLRLGALAFVAHRTLFVHGGIMSGAKPDADPVISLGKVPDEPEKTYDSVEEWVDKLNAWYRREVEAWIQQPTWSVREDGQDTRGGNELLKYVLPDYPASVVMGRHLLPSGMPALLPPHVVDNLVSNSIDRVIVGHTPHGNCPTVINHDAGDKKLQVFMCDTSYSDAKAEDNRGEAASDVVLEPDGTVRVRGVLEDGHSIAYDSHDAIIGRSLTDGMQVKAKLADSERDEYLVYSVKNAYQYSYAYRAAEDLQFAE